MSENRINPGDANQITRDYFDSLLIEKRHLDGVKPSTKVVIFGKTFDTPIMMAAFSHMKTLEDVARAAAYLAEADYVTGAVLRVDGGLAM